METPTMLGIEKGTIIKPANGWETGLYLVDVAYSPDNPIHRSLMYLYYISDNNTIWSPHNHLFGDEGYIHPDQAYYLKVVRKVMSKDEIEYSYPDNYKYLEE